MPEQIPYHTFPGTGGDCIRRWIEDGIMPGSFLEAVIRNQLVEAFHRADSNNVELMYDIVGWMYRNAPGACWHYPENVKHWLARGGRSGRGARPEDLPDPEEPVA
jgi:hypothetical protein